MDDEALLRGRVYGSEYDDCGPRAGRLYRELVAGPLDVLLLDVTGWSTEELADGAALITELGAYGAGGRRALRPPAGGSGPLGLGGRQRLTPGRAPSAPSSVPVNPSPLTIRQSCGRRAGRLAAHDH